MDSPLVFITMLNWAGVVSSSLALVFVTGFEADHWKLSAVNAMPVVFAIILAMYVRKLLFSIEVAFVYTS